MTDETRGPKNLQGLFNFCMRADDGGNLKDNNIDPKEAAEKSVWLKKVMEESCINIGQRTKENMNILYQVIESKGLNENSIAALEELQDITEHIEYAKDFIKMGGLQMIKKLLSLNIPEILIESAQLLGNVIQNDEVCQKETTNNGFIEFLLDKIDKELNGNVVKKLVYALSCCVRGNEEGLKRFKSVQGVQILLNCMAKGTGEASQKCSFLIYCLANESDISFVLSEIEFLELLKKARDISTVMDPAMEFLIGVIAIVLKQKSDLQNVITVDFISWLSVKLDESKDKPELEELVNHLQYVVISSKK